MQLYYGSILKSSRRVVEAEETRGCKSHMMLEPTCNPGTCLHADLSPKLLCHFMRLETENSVAALKEGQVLE